MSGPLPNSTTAPIPFNILKSRGSHRANPTDDFGWVFGSPIVLSYDGVYLWKKAVEKAGTFDVDAVRKVLESGNISFDGPGGKITIQANHHCTKNVYIGETKANGQFKILKTIPQVVAEPFLSEYVSAKN